MNRVGNLIVGGVTVVGIVMAVTLTPRAQSSASTAGKAGAAQTAAPQAAAPQAAQPQAPPKQDPPLNDSTVFTWESLKANPTSVGFSRRVVRAQTATLEELESHITTLNPGVASHAPHTHPNEEMIILKEGTLEAFVEGKWVPMSTGSMVFFASNHPHAVRNPGTVPATYYVVNWNPPGLLIRNPAPGK